MPYCPKCGVELDSQIKNCPLCSFPIPDTGSPDSESGSRYSFLLNRHNLKKAEQKKKWMEAKPFVFISLLLTLIVLSAVFGILDIHFFKGFTWSRYVIAINAAVVLIMFFLMRLIPSISFNFIGIGMTVMIFLYLIDSFSDNVNWFWTLGLIICFNTMFWTLILRKAILHSKRKGLNIVSYILFSISIACFSIDLFYNFAVSTLIKLSWSIPVISVAVPLAILFILLHLLLSPVVKEKLKRKFHI